MNIAIVGGGPAGLFFALLMKKHDPRHDVRVYEQNSADATYGWGVVFSEVALAFLRDADAEFYADFTANHEHCAFMEVVHHGVHVQMHNNAFARASRIDLLRILQDHCSRAGVSILFNTRIDHPEELAGADLVVAADGVNSTLRTRFADRFLPTIETGRNMFAWYGTHQLIHPLSLIFRQTEHGVFIAHAYQYSKALSTFLVEVDPDTWQRAGLDRMSDEQSRDWCTRVFRPELGANPLLSNRSRWFQASIVRNLHWSYGNMVLLGDALRTVHFSLGSGTRMAMQDAIALQRAITAHPGDLPAAFAHFQQARGTESAEFQAAAAKSIEWYETVAARMHLDPVAFACDYMCRTGRVSIDDLRRRDPRLVEAYEALQQRNA
ncbi:MAG TPA: FAD-dependent monooxygenase [Casimicrobiaceae bacterium]|nr:FAD-dependent monooxygenase [Casimicrobiaceae bacterium]